MMILLYILCIMLYVSLFFFLSLVKAKICFMSQCINSWLCKIFIEKIVVVVDKEIYGISRNCEDLLPCLQQPSNGPCPVPFEFDLNLLRFISIQMRDPYSSSI
jgi:hypothetical protein